MAHEFRRQPLTTQASIRSRPIPIVTMMDMLALGQVSPGVFRLSYVSISPLLPHAYLNL
jgi:hypothetical protein